MLTVPFSLSLCLCVSSSSTTRWHASCSIRSRSRARWELTRGSSSHPHGLSKLGNPRYIHLKKTYCKHFGWTILIKDELKDEVPYKRCCVLKLCCMLLSPHLCFGLNVLLFIANISLSVTCCIMLLDDMHFVWRYRMKASCIISYTTVSKHHGLSLKTITNWSKTDPSNHFLIFWNFFNHIHFDDTLTSDWLMGQVFEVWLLSLSILELSEGKPLVVELLLCGNRK